MAQTDGDGDGVPDDRDRCPREAGPASNGGGPLPDIDGDPITRGVGAQVGLSVG